MALSEQEGISTFGQFIGEGAGLVTVVARLVVGLTRRHWDTREQGLQGGAAGVRPQTQAPSSAGRDALAAASSSPPGPGTRPGLCLAYLPLWWGASAGPARWAQAGSPALPLPGVCAQAGSLQLLLWEVGFGAYHPSGRLRGLNRFPV